MTNEDRLVLHLRKTGKAICDDCLSEILDITPRQQVNQIARRLAQANIIRREKGLCSCKAITKWLNSALVAFLAIGMLCAIADAKPYENVSESDVSHSTSTSKAKSDRTMNWKEANVYCYELGARLPNLQELASILKEMASNIDSGKSNDTIGNVFWSSELGGDGIAFARDMEFPKLLPIDERHPVVCYKESALANNTSKKLQSSQDGIASSTSKENSLPALREISSDEAIEFVKNYPLTSKNAATIQECELLMREKAHTALWGDKREKDIIASIVWNASCVSSFECIVELQSMLDSKPLIFKVNFLARKLYPGNALACAFVKGEKVVKKLLDEDYPDIDANQIPWEETCAESIPEGLIRPFYALKRAYSQQTTETNGTVRENKTQHQLRMVQADEIVEFVKNYLVPSRPNKTVTIQEHIKYVVRVTNLIISTNNNKDNTHFRLLPMPSKWIGSAIGLHEYIVKAEADSVNADYLFNVNLDSKTIEGPCLVLDMIQFLTQYHNDVPWTKVCRLSIPEREMRRFYSDSQN